MATPRAGEKALGALWLWLFAVRRGFDPGRAQADASRGAASKADFGCAQA